MPVIVPIAIAAAAYGGAALATAGALTAIGIAATVTGAIVAGAVAGAVTGAVVGGAYAAMTGGDIGKAALQGAIMGGISGAFIGWVAAPGMLAAEAAKTAAMAAPAAAAAGTPAGTSGLISGTEGFVGAGGAAESAKLTMAETGKTALTGISQPATQQVTGQDLLLAMREESKIAAMQASKDRLMAAGVSTLGPALAGAISPPESAETKADQEIRVARETIDAKAAAEKAARAENIAGTGTELGKYIARIKTPWASLQIPTLTVTPLLQA